MAARSPLRLNEISESILRQLIAEYRQVLDEHPDLELAIRSILDSAVGADGAVHITDEVDRQLVDLIADARFNKVARETGRALRDELAARGQRSPQRAGPLLLMALIDMDGDEAEFR
ncbi:hypothetical protein KL864_31740 [Mycolicibacterium goodii]|mgnify:CR=1 FL=1|uniref:hypothetical protein n=1 Tax=Mycolicibacterium goodii TaxID=134601 RepID=UPI001BDD0D52|nr:hypothetical protein [Mycolicibacterium goodii]MBU8820450.1 hypothetical protein [Mycolicibacterium goodii]